MDEDVRSAVPRDEMEGGKDNIVYPTGMVRSADVEDYAFHLVSPIAYRAWAAAYRRGEIKYSAYNCEKGCAATEFLKHAELHILRFKEGDRSEDNLGAAMWNIGMMIHSLALWPHLNGNLRRAGCIPPSVSDEDAKGWRPWPPKVSAPVDGNSAQSMESWAKAEEATREAERRLEANMLAVNCDRRDEVIMRLREEIAALRDRLDPLHTVAPGDEGKTVPRKGRYEV
jgi:hypothetical protein